MLSRNDLHAYQRKAVDFILREGRCMLALEMGLGKTASTLTAIRDMIDGCRVSRVLVIAPLRVANSVWAQEVKCWDHLKDLRVSVCTGSERARRSALCVDADIYVINRENVPWLVQHYGKKWPFDAVVVDESSSFKTSSTKRFKALRKMLPNIETMILLTGTPSPNGLLDLWAQMYLIDYGQRLGRTLTGYKQRFFEPDFMGYKFSIRAGADKQIHALVADRVMHMSAADYLDLPPRIDITHAIDMPPKAAAAYREFETTMLADLDDGSEIEALSAAALANKLLQWSNGAVYTDEHKNWSETHTAKLDALQAIVEDNEGEAMLVAYNYRSDLARLLERFPAARVLDKDQATIDAWNRGEIPMLLAHPACLHPSTEVLTEYRGWVRIVDVKANERVFDGLEFVSHSGCHFSGFKPVIEVFGVKMTPCHKLLLDGAWVEAKNVSAVKDARRKALYTYAGDDSRVGRMFKLRNCVGYTRAELSTRKPAGAKTLPGLHRRNISQDDGYSHLEDLARDEGPLHKPKRSRLSQLWRTWNNNAPRVAELRCVLSGHVRRLCGKSDTGQGRQFARLFKRELSVGFKHGSAVKQEEQPRFRVARRENALGRVLPKSWGRKGRNTSKAKQGNECGGSAGGLQRVNLSKEQEVSDVYDLVDCGPRSRFLIRNASGDVFISHNSAGHGLNLQRGGALCVWFGLNWSLEYYLQFNARLHRQGQDRPVRIVHIVCRDTIDERVLSVLSEKDAVQNSLLNALKPKW